MPTVFVFLDAMPLTSPKGKVDRRALPRPDRKPRNADFVGPRDALEAVLATIWMDVLGLERGGVHGDFFELGGHSLLALKVASRIRKSLEIDVPLAKLFDLSTIAGVANEVRREAPVVAPSPRIHG